jgi:hypothetical protein
MTIAPIPSRSHNFGSKLCHFEARATSIGVPDIYWSNEGRLDPPVVAVTECLAALIAVINNY